MPELTQADIIVHEGALTYPIGLGDQACERGWLMVVQTEIKDGRVILHIGSCASYEMREHTREIDGERQSRLSLVSTEREKSAA